MRDSREIQYVVMFQAVNLLSGEGGGLSQQCGPRIQESWEFVHPRPDVLLDNGGLPITNTHNVRSTSLTFHIPHAGVLHGLAGYFEAVLYGSIGLSIHPERMESISKDMLSWFPIFFPFRVSHVNLAYKPVDLIYRPELFRSPSSCQVIRNSMCQCGGLQTRGRCGMSGVQKLFFLQRSCSLPQIHLSLRGRRLENHRGSK